MKSIFVQQSPHSSPWAPMRLRHAMQTGGSRRSASAMSAPRNAPLVAKECAAGLFEVISAPPIAMDAMDAMIEPGAGMAEEARNA